MRIWIVLMAMAMLPAVGFAHEKAQPTAAASSSEAAVQEAAKVVDAFHDALKKGDKDGALKHLDDSVQIFEQGWVERSKAEYAGHHLGSDAEFSAATTSRRTARGGAIVGDLAYVISEGTVTGTFKDKAIDSVSLETMVLRGGADGWRIVHIHWSSRTAKK